MNKIKENSKWKVFKTPKKCRNQLLPIIFSLKMERATNPEPGWMV